MGWIQPSLPYEIKPDWFNGEFVLNDREGWGLIHPEQELRASSGQIVSSDDVLSYAYDGALYVKVNVQSGRNYFVAIDDADFQKTPLIAYTPSEFNSYKKGNKINVLDWISVDPKSCFYGSLNLLKIVCLVVIAVLVAYLLVGLKRRQS